MKTLISLTFKNEKGVIAATHAEVDFIWLPLEMKHSGQTDDFHPMVPLSLTMQYQDGFLRYVCPPFDLPDAVHAIQFRAPPVRDHQSPVASVLAAVCFVAALAAFVVLVWAYS